ncbi:RHS repeat domain-containing protein [Niastella caeni]|nr:RHS repeat-associated core domain-containing protein [Niastella caeni]
MSRCMRQPLPAMLLGIAIITIHQRAWAAGDDGIEDEPLFSILAGSPTLYENAMLYENTPALLQDNATADLTFTQGYESDKKIKNIITLSLWEETPEFLPDSFTATVTVRIQYGVSAGALMTPIDKQFEITYNKRAGVKYNAKQYFSFEGAQYVKITVLNVNAPTVNGYYTRNALVLQNEMRVTRYYNTLKNGVTPTTFATVQPQAGDDELSVNWVWPQDAGYTHTQLEWTWLEDELAPASIDYDLLFKNNATRIDLPAGFLSYKIPLLYGDTGKLYCRIRAVNINKNGSRTDGPWSTPQIRSFIGHNRALNWQSMITFSEDGKRKAVVQYYDGSLRSRQTVTKNNTTNTIVTAETFYDGQGRAAVAVLPAPDTSKKIAYKPGLNLFTSNTQLNLVNNQTLSDDPAKYFDMQPIATATSITPALNTNAGASQYYSAGNLELSAGANVHIPDAEGYPYTVTRYMPDATGRIMSQSGVGAAMQLGKGHETKYFYGTPAQVELDGLFGTEVGNYTHYYKNMVKDANGQMSVNYVDMHGRTIATALAGDPPTNLVGLDLANQYPYAQGGTLAADLTLNTVTGGDQKATNAIFLDPGFESNAEFSAEIVPQTSASQVTRNLLDKNSNITKNNSIEAINSLLVPATTNYSFIYELTPQSLQLPACTGPSVCYDCLYDLEISITDETGDQDPIIRRFKNVSLRSGDDCSSGSAPSVVKDTFINVSNIACDTIINHQIKFCESLQPGSYTVRKTLTISDSSMQAYKDLYLTKGLCKTEQQLIDSVYAALLTVSTCDDEPPANTCTDCLTKLGNENDYRTNYLISIGNPASVPDDIEKQIAAGYKAAKLNCEKLCNTTSQVLATKRLMMLADMVPYSGQYAKETGSGEMYYKYNIFSTANTSSFSQPFYKTPRNSSGPDLYRTSNGTVDYGIQPDGTVANLATTTQEAFADQFAHSWAESLLPYHPEYGKLVYAENNLTTSYNWITTFNNTTTYADAVSKGYIFTADGNLSDPFYSQATNYRADIVTKINSNYRQNLSLWQIAYGDAACKDIIDPAQKNSCFQNAPKTPAATTSPSFNSMTTAQKDQAWQRFRSLYAMERENHLNSFVSDNVALADNQQLIDQGYLLHFASNDQMAQQYGNNQQSTIGENSWAWYPTTPGGAPNINNIPEASNPALIYASRCNSYIGQWVKSITQCTALIGNPDSTQIVNLITAGMVDVCQRGSDAANPFGSSTIAPGVGGSPDSFEQVIKNVFLQYNIAWDNFCNPFVIEFPKPYNKGPVFTKQVIAAVDTCNCSRFAKLKIEAQENGANPAILSSFNQYLKSKYRDTLTQVLYDGLVKGCPQIGTTTCYDAMVPTTMACGNTPPCGCEFVSSSGNNCNYNCPQRICNTVNPYPLTSAQPMPDFLNCGFDAKGCVTCATLSSLTADFKALMPAPYNAGPVFADSNLTATNIRDNIAYAQFLNYRTGLQYTWMDYAKAAAAAGCNLANYSGNSGATQPVICADTLPLNDATDMYLPEQPCQKVYNMAVALAQQLYDQRMQNLLANFEEQYRAKCLAVQDIEQFSVKYTSREYHYTLYYYDMAGNLVTTVPPKGVHPKYDDQFLTDVKNGRTTNTRVAPPHTFLTNYRYNSFNKVIAQNSPDGGTSAFWYDNLARMVIGQNAQQAVDGKYSYTLFDDLGRVIEVGQKPQSTGMSQTISQNIASLDNWLNASGGVKEQLTITAYDNAYPILVGTYMTQQNMRNRVSYRATKKLATDGLHYTAIFFTYDIHGNIDTVLQDYRDIAEMTGSNNRFKLMTYDYDLVSSKVRLLSYQPGQPDAFYHRYTYDAENRTEKVETSRDKIYWERDAAYRYYKHGQLARTELGQMQVQGVDYAYTVQGWKKGINSTTIGDGAFDIGQDGFASSNNTKVARDVFGFALHYFDAVNGNTWSDYSPIGGTSAFAKPDAGSSFVSMFNGNIGGISMNNAGFAKADAGTTNTLPLFYKYRYDQLNRLVSMQAYKGLNTATNQWSAIAMNGNDYAESITYDPNGNILSYNRKGAPEIGKPADMDALTYNYDANKNRLNYIHDGVTSMYTEDLEAQSVNNYTYDENGNLKSDFAAGITGITWTAYGKIASISKGSNTTTFTYDASANRITKTADGTTTIYVRDATGNVMSVYTKPTTGSLQQAEIDLYGAGRLGITTTTSTDTALTQSLDAGYGVAIISTFTRNEKIFELSNHLGNVLVTVGDKKIQHSSNGTTVDYYNADIFNANDYYPFGMLMPGRTYAAAGSYRYGFNGKENDNEIKGEGNQQDYGMRVYDPRIGKFLSVDPLTASYPWYTPYQFAGNKPINSIDLDGMEEYATYDDYAKAKGKDALKVMDGSDGAWLESDRKERNPTWSNAMEAITKNGWSDRLRDNPGKAGRFTAQGEIGSAFEVVRDYYLWVQSKVDALGYKSRWAKGAAYLVDELADTYEDFGVTSGGMFPKMGKLLRDLNFGIADYAVKRFHDLFYEGDVAKGNSYLAWYKWDKEFIDREQGPIAFEVYSTYAGKSELNSLNSLSRKSGLFIAAGPVSKHFFPNFSKFDDIQGEGKAEVNNAQTIFAEFYRINIPMFMLYPSTHGTMSGIKLNSVQQTQVNDAYKGVNEFYESSKINK